MADLSKAIQNGNTITTMAEFPHLQETAVVHLDTEKLNVSILISNLNVESTNGKLIHLTVDQLLLMHSAVNKMVEALQNK